MFDKFESRYILRGKLELVSGLHIGGGASSVVGSDSAVQKDFDGNPFIPGSSFKGVLRSSLEAILRGLDNDNLKSCEVVSGKSCITIDNKGDEPLEIKDDWIYINEKKKKELVEKGIFETFIFSNSCDICRLFGSPFLGSKIFIKDLTVDKETFYNIEVRDFVAIDRDTLTAKDKGKFDAEIVPAGTRFDLEIVVENPEPYELGLLCAGFDLFDDGQIMIGGMTSRGLGRVEIKIDENIKVINRENILQKTDQYQNYSTLRAAWNTGLADKIKEANNA